MHFTSCLQYIDSIKDITRLQILKLEAIAIIDPITPYLHVKKYGGDLKVIEKRCHSPAWHQERDRKMAQGLLKDEAKTPCVDFC